MTCPEAKGKSGSEAGLEWGCVNFMAENIMKGTWWLSHRSQPPGGGGKGRELCSAVCYRATGTLGGVS